MGSSCSASFEDTVFERCTLVMAGAQATLKAQQFRDMASCTDRISIFAHGAASMAAVSAGTITGGLKGATVQAGACLEASDLTVTEVQNVGVEVEDEGSTATLSGCTLRSFAPPGHSEEDHGHCSSGAHDSDSSTSGMLVCVMVHTRGHAKLSHCTVSQTKHQCAAFLRGARGTLENCTLSDSKWHPALLVRGSC